VARKGCGVVICVGTFFAWLRALELRRILMHMKHADAARRILALSPLALTAELAAAAELPPGGLPMAVLDLGYARRDALVAVARGDAARAVHFARKAQGIARELGA
jgi:hypothetical protein